MVSSCIGALREIQRHHIKRSTGKPQLAPCLFDWKLVKKVVLEEAKGQINENRTDLPSLEAYLFVESIGKSPY